MTNSVSSLLLRIFRFSSLFLPFFGRRKNEVFFTLGERNAKGGPGRFHNNLWRAWENGSLKPRIFWGANCKSVLIQGKAPNRLFLWACKFLEIKTILRVDGFYLPEKGDRVQRLSSGQKALNQGMKMTLEHVDHVIYQSKFCKEQMDKTLFERKKGFSFILNGTNLKHFASPEREAKIEGLKILMLGFHRDKDVMELSLKAYETYQKLRPAARLTLVGRLTPEVKKVLEDYSHVPNIDCIGEKSYEELPSILAKNHVQIHLKFGDWCPNSVIESQAAGLPTICLSFGGTKEIVREAGVCIEHDAFSYDQELVEKVNTALIEVEKFYPQYLAKVEKQRNSLDIMATSQIYKQKILEA